MRNLKKFLAITLIFSLSLSMVACGKELKQDESSLDPKNPITITFWHYYSDKSEHTLEQLVEEFNETVGLEKGIIVDPVNKGKIMELEAAVTDSASGVINSQKMPNIFSSYIDKAVELDEMGKIVDLNAYFTQEEKSEYVEGFVDAGMYEKKMLILPLVKSTEILFLNKNAWDAYKAFSGATDKDMETWEGISKISKNYQRHLSEHPEKMPADKAFFGMDVISNFIIIGMKDLGVDVIDGKNKKANLDEKAMRKIFDIYYKNMIEGGFFVNAKFRTDNIKTGEIISYAGSTSGGNYFPLNISKEGKEEPIELLALKYPKFEGTEPHYILQGAGLAISKAKDAELEASVEFLKWFTNDKNNFRFAVDTGYLPSRKSLYKDDKFENMIEELEKDPVGKNVAKIYRVAKSQILEGPGYFTEPFNKSYHIRDILSKTLQNKVVETLEDNVSANEVNYDEEFRLWMENVKTELERQEINYEVF